MNSIIMRFFITYQLALAALVVAQDDERIVDVFALDTENGLGAPSFPVPGFDGEAMIDEVESGTTKMNIYCRAPADKTCDYPQMSVTLATDTFVGTAVMTSAPALIKYQYSDSSTRTKYAPKTVFQRCSLGLVTGTDDIDSTATADCTFEAVQTLPGYTIGVTTSTLAKYSGGQISSVPVTVTQGAELLPPARVTAQTSSSTEAAGPVRTAAPAAIAGVALAAVLAI